MSANSENSEDIAMDEIEENVDNAKIVKGSEMSNMFLIEFDGVIKQVENTPEKKLLFKRKDLHDFLFAGERDERRVLSLDPYIAVKPISEDEFTFWYNDEDVGVKVEPEKSNKFLRGIVDYVDNSNVDRLKTLYREIISGQVRRKIVNPLSVLYPQDKVVPTDDGWIIRGLFRISWDARVFVVGSGPKDQRESRSGTYEVLELSSDSPVETKSVTVNGKTYELTEKEMEFLGKVEYFLEYEKRSDDDAFISVLRRQVRGEPNYAN